jgi:predicted metal-binding membrane protein
VTGAATWLDRHPEWWVLTLSGAAWLGIACLAGPMATGSLCVAARGGLTGDLAGRLLAQWRIGALDQMLGAWAVMALAMVPPLTLPMLRYVATRSFAFRRMRALALSLAGLLCPWLAAGVIGIALLAVAPVPDGRLAALAFALAALWELSPIKRRALRRCHRAVPLAAQGWRADRDCFVFGCARGLDCLVSCWAMMLAVMLADHALAAILLTQALAFAERRAREPRVERCAVVLAALGALWVVPL